MREKGEKTERASETPWLSDPKRDGANRIPFNDVAVKSGCFYNDPTHTLQVRAAAPLGESVNLSLIIVSDNFSLALSLFPLPLTLCTFFCLLMPFSFLSTAKFEKVLLLTFWRLAI